MTVSFGLFPYPQIKMMKEGELFSPPPKDYREINITAGMIYGVNKELQRLPISLKDQTRSIIWSISKHSSGGRIKFKTDASSIYIDANSKHVKPSRHMTNIMKHGVDIYVNNEYYGSSAPSHDTSIKEVFNFQKEKEFNEITIHLPLYGEIKINKIMIPSSTQIKSSDDLLDKNPIVYYGSSITQGGCASNPGLSYQAILSRRLHIDFINLGFVGNGLGDYEIADYISNIKSSLIVLDYYANPTPEVYKNTLPTFVDRIRKNQPTTPILIISPFYSVNLFEQQNEKREIALKLVKKRGDKGDKNIYYYDGRRSLSREQSFGLVDGRHLNSLGFWFAANGLEPKIKELLNIK